MKFADALKNMRRGIHVHGASWRTAVIAPNAGVSKVAFDEAGFLLESSSLAIQMKRAATMTIQTEKDAVIRFFHVADSFDLYALMGNSFTQIIVLQGQYSTDANSRFRAQLRSAVVPEDQLLLQEGVVI